MNWTIKVSTNAEKYFKKLDKKLKERIKNHLKEISTYDNPLGYAQVRPLTGELRGFYRLRIGNYRIVFSLIQEYKVIAVVNIVPRGDAY